MNAPDRLPDAGHADISIVASTPDVARQVAEILRRCFTSTEQRSFPVDPYGGTRLQLTVDTTRTAEPARTWLESSAEKDHPRTEG
ncbi:hypothetical protein [Streptomyces buecherae]|uniref:hypothetical protein n=1 Tax=Streptomyces buecherae TaxID=2763006 RepID=UPI0036661D4C